MDHRAPRFALYVEGVKLQQDVTDDVLSVDYDDSVDVASELRVTVNNAGGKYTDIPLFDPGNEVELFLGYGEDLKFVGRGEIVRHLPIFDSSGVSTLDFKAWSKSWRMMGQEMRLAGTGKASGKGKRKAKKAEDESGRLRSGTVGGIIADIADNYGFDLEMDSSFYAIKEAFLQRKGMSDYQVCKALASLYDANFWVGYSHKSLGGSGSWTLYFLTAIGEPRNQEVVYDFRWADGPDSTLESISLQHGISDTETEYQAFVLDQVTKQWVPISIDLDTTSYSVSIRRSSASAARKSAQDKAAGEGPNMRKILGDFYDGMSKIGVFNLTGGVFGRIANASEYGGQPTGPLLPETKKKKGSVKPGGKPKASTKAEWKESEGVDSLLTKGAGVSGEIKDHVVIRLVTAGHSVRIVRRPFKNPADAIPFIEKWIKDRRDSYIIADGTLAGLEPLRAGQRHRISGVGERYSGYYYFANVKHSFSSTGYKTDFTARKVIL